MPTPKLSSREDAAIINALEYWIERWDWESPTLFGLELARVQAIRNEWPAVKSTRPRESWLAALGALRELLYGASALGSEAVQAICGMPSDEVESLLRKVRR